MEYLIIDDNGTIHTGNEDDMNIAFAAMTEDKDFFSTKKEFKEAVKEYKTDWSGDLMLVEVKKTAR